MESTACGKECPFVKQGFCNSDKECPHYVESWWQKGDTQVSQINQRLRTKTYASSTTAYAIQIRMYASCFRRIKKRIP